MRSAALIKIRRAVARTLPRPVRARLAKLRGKPAAPDLGFVFGIGFNKTGTSSLSAALHAFGYRCMHHSTPWMSGLDLDRAIKRAVTEGLHPLHYVPRLAEEYNAFFDILTLQRRFDAFADAFPRAKFILHVRDLEPWLESRTKHVQRNIEMGRTTWIRIVPDEWTAEYHAHHEAVREYFKDQPERLLVIDVTTGSGEENWQKLSSFLGLPIPDRPFPRANTAETALEEIRRAAEEAKAAEQAEAAGSEAAEL